MRKTRTREIIYLAYKKGYRITENGMLTTLTGKSKKPTVYGKQKYPTFSVNIGNGENYGIPFHMFAAYCFYGDDCFKEGLVIRHLNGNTEDCSKKNIVIGTHSENNMDKDPLIRSYSARKARLSQGHPKNRKLSEKQVKDIRKNPEKLTVKELSKKYKTSNVCIYNIINRRTYID